MTLLKKTYRYLLAIQLILLSLIPIVLAFTTISPQDAQDKLNSENDVVIIDVREESEYCSEQGHIPGSENYPYSSGIIEDRYDELNSDDEIVVVCASGNRSMMASTFLDEKGFTAILNMDDGMGAWEGETETCDDDPITGSEDNSSSEDDEEDIVTGDNDTDTDENSNNNESEEEENDDDPLGCFIMISSGK